MRKHLQTLFLFSVLSFLFTVSSVAQVTTASISGKVVYEDEPVIGATVVAIHEPSGTRYGTVTNIDGRYTLPNMRAGGPYKVDISYVGYQPIAFTNISLNLGDNYALNASLKESSELLEEVVVIGSSNSNMKSDRAGAITSITREGIEAIPTISRSMNDIMRMSPQSSTTTNGFAVGGGNYRQSYVTVDGAAFNNAFGIGQNLPANGSPISLDALEQITVSVTPYDVRQSGFTGGSINAVTRSGDNKFKATAYTYLNNQSLKGVHVDDYTLKRSKAQYYTYGASIGGAIIKDKLFYFVNGEYEDNVTAGPITRPRTSDSEQWGDNNVNRPTVSDMDMMSKYMSEKYGYNTGRYSGYDIKTPAYRIMARLDWNINDNNKINFRFSKTHTKDSNSPSSSTSPMNAANIYPGHGNNGGRSSKYAMTYENSRYYQLRDFMSLATELNSRFMDGKMNNMVRLTYSYQNEPRETDGGFFPTVDILKDGDVYASFGPDPFTYGNLRRVKTFVATDELSYSTGIHSMLGGVQFEFNHSENGFMPAGSGYYVFSSWDDFVNNQKPSAFAITHPNNNGLKQENAAFNYEQVSLYYQDEMAFTENFKLTAGLRLEVPIYPALKNNYNEEFAGLLFHGKHYSTDQMPKTTVNLSPRVGFNWDLTGERKYVLRGGMGLYTGRIPFVWIVSAVGNSNVGQYQMFTYKSDEAPNFSPDLNGILNNMYGGKYEAKALPAPQSPTIMTEDLKMPSTFKTSLAFDAKLPGDIGFTVEGIYNRDINPIVVTNAGLNDPSEVKLSANDTRLYYNNGYCATNSEGRGVTPYVIENGGDQAYYYSITSQLSKRFNFGLDLSFAYTYSYAKSYGDGIGDQVTSAWKTNTNCINGSNAHEIGYASYVAPNRIIASAGYRKEYGKNFASAITLIYEGSQLGYAGNYSYSRFGYTYSNNPLNDGGATPLMYIPASKDELNFADIVDKSGKVTYSKEDQANDFWAYVNQDKYLSKHKGEYADRNGAVMPWCHQFDLKFMQDFYVKVGNSRNTIQFGIDIKNLGNLLNNKWGIYKQVSTNGNSPLKFATNEKGAIIRDENGDFMYNMNKNGSQKLTETFMNYQGFASTSSVQFSIRYIFN
ncbi:TonB-dependent receptor [Parabacteroides chinchillae]|uniref:Carboxypeptidase regulatory-like domain-containing protein n=1 Tax=Parabacteroides chinchillae TaxID=871327 RepID=A0A8G2BYD8_9BACT|nr:TonB-dependent receptor [Parabacteroides chinchillae]SEG18134.1 Carboxypeptidase regulatory-like domain-containing protein [Parabacteroides chinchillae]